MLFWAVTRITHLGPDEKALNIYIGEASSVDQDNSLEWVRARASRFLAKWRGLAVSYSISKGAYKANNTTNTTPLALRVYDSIRTRFALGLQSDRREMDQLTLTSISTMAAAFIQITEKAYSLRTTHIVQALDAHQTPVKSSSTNDGAQEDSVRAASADKGRNAAEAKGVLTQWQQTQTHLLASLNPSHSSSTSSLSSSLPVSSPPPPQLVRQGQSDLYNTVQFLRALLPTEAAIQRTINEYVSLYGIRNHTLIDQWYTFLKHRQQAPTEMPPSNRTDYARILSEASLASAPLVVDLTSSPPPPPPPATSAAATIATVSTGQAGEQSGPNATASNVEGENKQANYLADEIEYVERALCDEVLVFIFKVCNCIIIYACFHMPFVPQYFSYFISAVLAFCLHLIHTYYSCVFVHFTALPGLSAYGSHRPSEGHGRNAPTSTSNSVLH